MEKGISFEENLKILMKSKVRCIWINTLDEQDTIDAICTLSSKLKKSKPVYVHSFASGTKKMDLLDGKSNHFDSGLKTDKLLGVIDGLNNSIPMETDPDKIQMLKEDGATIIESFNNIFIFKDFHQMITNPVINRTLKDVIASENNLANYNPILILSQSTDIPLELEKLVEVIDHDLPGIEVINTIIEAYEENMKKKNELFAFEYREKIALGNSMKGLTKNEIIKLIAITKNSGEDLTTKSVDAFKIELIKKANVLEYKTPKAVLSDIGGNAAFKVWVDEVLDSMTPEAAEFGCTRPKGYLALGVPGSAKTLLAEALANSMNLPFLKIDMSKILDSKVGGSEKNMAYAIKTIKSIAPCLLLIDEVEKTLSGMKSSNASDGGTMARAIGAILEFLSDNEDVFVVMTSNDVAQLPPELTRTGRIDATWYFGIPEEDERKDIFDIHFKKYKRNLNEGLLKYASSKEVSNQLTGAEIEEAVKNTIRKAYHRYRKDGNKEITKEDIKGSCSEIIPIATSSREQIAVLNEYAKNRARFSNKIVNEFNCNVSKNSEISRILSMDDIMKNRVQ